MENLACFDSLVDTRKEPVAHTPGILRIPRQLFVKRPVFQRSADHGDNESQHCGDQRPEGAQGHDDTRNGQQVPRVARVADKAVRPAVADRMPPLRLDTHRRGKKTVLHQRPRGKSIPERDNTKPQHINPPRKERRPPITVIQPRDDQNGKGQAHRHQGR